VCDEYWEAAAKMNGNAANQTFAIFKHFNGL